MDNKIFVRMQCKRDTSANWKNKNTVLLDGEIALETDTKKIKIGDGVTTYNNLEYRLTQDVDIFLQGEDKPTTSTEGKLGQIYIDTLYDNIYQCVNVNNENNTYIWKQIITVDMVDDLNGGVGQKTDDNGEIFNDYENNKAISEKTHSEGSSTVAGGRGYNIISNEYDTPVFTNYYYISCDQRLVDEYNLLKENNVLLVCNIYISNVGAEYNVPIQGVYIESEEFMRICIKGTNENNEANPHIMKSEGSTDDAYITIVGLPELGDIDIGVSSHAEGLQTQAIEKASHAEGRYSKAIGKYAHAEGYDTKAAYAAHAEGNRTTALGFNAHSEGVDTVASGNSSHAEGSNTIASGENSHAEGYFSQSSGNYSHSEGNRTKSIGDFSHAEGKNSQSKKSSSHAEGENTIADGDWSHAEGCGGKASGQGSHKEGVNSVASGYASHAEGKETKAMGTQSHSEGELSQSNAPISHAEGKETKAGSRAFNILGKDDNAKTFTLDSVEGLVKDQVYTVTMAAFYPDYGKITNIDTINKIVTVDKIPTDVNAKYEDRSNDEDKNVFRILAEPDLGTKYIGLYSHTEGIGTRTIGVAAHAEGKKTIANGSYSHAEGYSTVASYGAHSEGLKTQATGFYSHSEGENTIASGADSHAEGKETVASGAISHAEGIKTQATAQGAHAEGHMSEAKGQFSHAEGTATASADYSHAEAGSTASGLYSHAEGQNSIASGQSAHSEGNLTVASNECSHAEGENTKAKGKYSHSEGLNSEAQGAYSHAENNSFAIGEGSHSEGSSSAKGVKSHSEGNSTSNGLYAHAEGEVTNANGRDSHSEGEVTIADGNYSHAEGSRTEAYGTASHTEGANVKTYSKASHAEGYKTNAGSKAFRIIGKIDNSTFILNTHNGLQNGDIVSITLNNLYPNCGKIISCQSYDFNGITASKVIIDGTVTEDFNESYSTTKLDKNVLRANGKYDIGDVYIGNAAHAEGENTQACDRNAHAEGKGTKALYCNSHAEGENTIAGYSAHSEGTGTTAIGFNSHAEGVNTVASGNGSHAEGDATIASGQNSHAEGYDTDAIGTNSHAEGRGSVADNDCAHAEGYETNALNVNAHAEGCRTHATGHHSHAEGNETWATKESAHAEGDSSEANGNVSHAEGSHTTAAGDYSHSEGLSSSKASNYIYNDEFRFSLKSDDEIIEEWSKRNFALAKGIGSHIEGDSNLAIGKFSHAEGSHTATLTMNSHAEGYGTIATGNIQHVQGMYNIPDEKTEDCPDGKYAHIVGNGTSDNNRSNAHTVDWDGNAWFAGNINAKNMSYLGEVDLNQIFEPGLYSISINSTNLPDLDEDIVNNAVRQLFLKTSPYEVLEPAEGETYYTSRKQLQELIINGDIDQNGDMIYWSIIFTRCVYMESDTTDPNCIGFPTDEWVKVADSRPVKVEKNIICTNLNQVFDSGTYSVHSKAEGLPSEVVNILNNYDDNIGLPYIYGIMLKVANCVNRDVENSMVQELTVLFTDESGNDVVCIYDRYIFVDSSNNYIDAYNWVKASDSRLLNNNSSILTDTVTGDKYQLYVANGKLSMEVIK